MRNMSFSATVQQVRARTKTVTRRVGWKTLQPGEVLRAVEKGQGLRKGEKVKPICLIEVVTVRQEPLNAITPEDVVREGWPQSDPEEFVAFFCDFNMHRPEWPVTRIEFKYLDFIEPVSRIPKKCPHCEGGRKYRGPGERCSLCQGTFTWGYL